MMSDLDELYQELIMDHNRRPRNFRRVDDHDREANGYNPFCGDTVTLYLKMDGAEVAEVGFQGSGCAISKASASMMTEAVAGKSGEDARRVFDAFHEMLTRPPDSDEEPAEELGDLGVLSGVSEFPTRVKCATLPWHTLKAALDGRGETVKTE